MERRKFFQASFILPLLKGPDLGKILNDVGHSNEKLIADKNGSDKREFFYRPADGWTGDFIPLYANGEFHLFYLLAWRDDKNHGEGTPWYRISTTDFVHFKEHGEMLPRGTKEEQDLYVFTGSAIKGADEFHIFYTGHNPYMADKGKSVEAIMHAVSNDMKTWKKIPEQTFNSSINKTYERDDWRDPFVFWNEDAGKYYMLIAARLKEGIPHRRGLTALCSSHDLVKWEDEGPFYAPGLYYTHECPDLFKMGDWWYLLFSEFTDRVRTRYRMSRSLKGPWIVPERDDFDGHAFYAAKTASDGNKRFLFGWNPTRSGGKDDGDWDWGGNLVVHEIRQLKNGELTVNVPQTVYAAFGKPLVSPFIKTSGMVQIQDQSVNIAAEGTFGAAITGQMPPTFKFETTIIFEKDTRECGIILQCSDDFENCYFIRLDPQNNKLVFDKSPRNKSEVSEMVELTRPYKLSAGTPCHLSVFVDGHIGVVYLNDTIAMNFRAYDQKQSALGVFVTEGNASFKNCHWSTIS
jgi:beta-fructofuranosidase